MTPELRIICEGYDDRAFWAGWLGLVFGAHGQRQDPRGRVVTGGHFGFALRDRFVRLVLPKGDGVASNRHGVLKELGLRVRELASATADYADVLANVDDDGLGDDESWSGLRVRVSEIIGGSFSDARPLSSAVGQDRAQCWAFETQLGRHRVGLIAWSCEDTSTAGLPAQQTLERLVCAALRDAYPDRAAAVNQWLETRPDPPADSVKAWAWSHMAGWYPENRCDDFYKAVWRDATVRGALESRLRATGAWQLVESLVAG